jgi:NADH-quinone oxidoreductase subunit H
MGALSVPYFLAVFAVTAVAGLLTSWVDRKVTARVQARVGPPWYQPFADFVKLLGKETLVPEGSRQKGFLVAPLLALVGVSLGAAALVSGGILDNKGFVGDIVVVLYLLTIPSAALILGAAATGNPMASVGASREMKLLLGYELPFLIVVLTSVYKAQSSFNINHVVEYQAQNGMFIWSISGIIGFIIAILCIQGKLGLVPFDAPEAEQELMGGVLTEYSGVPLALFKLSKAMMLSVLALFLAVIFLGGMRFTPKEIPWSIIKYVVVVVLVVLIRNTNPRLRIDQVMKLFWGPLTVLALIGLLLAWLGRTFHLGLL